MTPITRTAVHRLSTLSAYLRKLDNQPSPPVGFDLGVWAGPDEQNDCGTVACAIGHACHITEFRGLGLRLVKVSLDGGRSVYWLPEFGTGREWNAVSWFFEIDPLDAYWLFSPSSYQYPQRRDPIAVADRIDAFIKERRP